MISINAIRILALCSAMALAGPVSFGAILYLEDFDDGANGWGTRDGEMTVAHDGGNEWMQGSFGASFLPQNDAFRISSGSNFTGDYSGNGLTQIRFELFSEDVLPSDLFFRMIAGADIFEYQFATINNLNNWQSFTLNLVWSFGWSGPGEAQFNSALTSVDAIEIQLTRNGTGVQNYYLDNVETLDTELGDPGAPGAVPEPVSVGLFAMGVVFLLAVRRMYVRPRMRLRSAMP